MVFAGIDGAVLLAYAMPGTASARRCSGTHTLHRIDRASGLTLLALAGGLAFWERG